jgi:hypothetical protein
VPIIKTDIAGTIRPILILCRQGSDTGIGSHAQSILQTLGSSVPMTVLDIDNPDSWSYLTLAAERYAAVVLAESPHLRPDLVSALADVGGRVPRACVFAWDSDQLDPYEVASMGASIDVVLSDDPQHHRWHAQASPHLEWFTFPLSIDVRAQNPLSLVRNKRSPRRQKVVSLGAYHPRKQHEFTIEVVHELVQEGRDLELILHSNLDQGEFQRIHDYAVDLLGNRAVVTNDDKSPQELLALYREGDVYVSSSRGETYNIPIRLALAAGVPAVAFNVSGHSDLASNPGFLGVKAEVPVPAVHPERDSRMIGRQWTGTREDLKTGLASLLAQVETGSGPRRSSVAIDAQRWDHRRRKGEMWDVFREAGLIETTWNSSAWPRRAQLNAHRRHGNDHSSRVSPRRAVKRLVIPADDAGFLALHNVFASHARWWAEEDVEVIPDWSARTVRRFRGDEWKSFCYAGADEGNVYFSLFESKMFDYDADTELDQLERAIYVPRSFNAKLDPFLTYVHPDRLYQSVAFQQWRQAMHDIVKKYLTPKPEILAEVDQLTQPAGQSPMLGMHIRHPSHAMEQPDGSLPTTDTFLNVAEAWLDRNPNAHVYLATDQEKVIQEALARLGDRVLTSKATRVSIEHSNVYEALPDDERLKEGHQVQHLAAADQSRHSSLLAKEVLIDTWALSRCSAVLHTVSNVATAVSFINPAAEMYYMRGGMGLQDLDNLRFMTRVMSPI